MDENAVRRAIECKRAGEELAPAQWERIVAGFARGTIDDAQMAALAMACIWRGMSTAEAAAMTRAMIASGATLSFPPGETVLDKHSTGGVSDVVSMIVVPLVAACGVRVAKLSGRALGHTGGTIDKLEAIPGFNASLSVEAFKAQVERIGCAIAAQTQDLVPADQRLYHLRDRTGTVPSVGLIAASIVSKKVAGGATAFVFDVKYGRGAFTTEAETAKDLALMLVAIARQFERTARAVVSDMNEPLGRSIGTGIEAIEARDFLRGNGSPRVSELASRIARTMLDLAGVAQSGRRVQQALESGDAYEKFVEMIEAQGGDRERLEALTPTLPIVEVTAARDGYVQAIDGVLLGNVVRNWTNRDPFAGLRLCVNVGDRVKRDPPLARGYGTNDGAAVREAFRIGDAAPPVRPLIYAEF